MGNSDFFSSFSAQSTALISQLTQLSAAFTRPMRAKLLLVFNHVIAQEPQARERLCAYAGRQIVMEVPFGQWRLTITPAGLFEEVKNVSEGEDLPVADLLVKMKTSNPLELVKQVFQDGRPAMDIQGDADLAATFAWMADNLRWDYEEDLSRVIGDVPTELAKEQLQTLIGFFRNFLDAFARRAKENRPDDGSHTGQ